jgi:hypothetical protein
LNPFVGVLLNPKYTAVAQQAQELAEAARTVCRPIVFLDASTDAELDAAFATLARQRVVAVLVAGDPFFDTRRDQIIALAAQQKLPALRSGGCSAFVKTGLSNPCASGGSTSPLEKHSRQILALISEESDLTLNEIVSALHKRFHKVAGVEEAIQAVGASLRYLPPYSPDLNPIELLFHPLKTWLRKAAERTMEGLHRCVGSYIRALDPLQCIAYFSSGVDLASTGAAQAHRFFSGEPIVLSSMSSGVRSVDACRCGEIAS